MTEDFWVDRPLLVTGGCGFIGSHLVEALLRSHARVRVLGRYNSSGLVGFLEPLLAVYPERLDIRLGDVADGEFVHHSPRGSTPFSISPRNRSPTLLYCSR